MENLRKRRVPEVDPRIPRTQPPSSVVRNPDTPPSKKSKTAVSSHVPVEENVQSAESHNEMGLNDDQGMHQDGISMNKTGSKEDKTAYDEGVWSLGAPPAEQQVLEAEIRQKQAQLKL